MPEEKEVYKPITEKQEAVLDELTFGQLEEYMMDMHGVVQVEAEEFAEMMETTVFIRLTGSAVDGEVKDEIMRLHDTHSYGLSAILRELR